VAAAIYFAVGVLWWQLRAAMSERTAERTAEPTGPTHEIQLDMETVRS
jgi:hypothetical protein